MHYITHYQSPLGTILLAACETGLTGLWFDGAKYYACGLDPNPVEKTPLFLTRPKNGWTFIFQAGNLTFIRLSI